MILLLLLGPYILSYFLGKWVEGKKFQIQHPTNNLKLPRSIYFLEYAAKQLAGFYPVGITSYLLLITWILSQWLLVKFYGKQNSMKIPISTSILLIVRNSLIFQDKSPYYKFIQFPFVSALCLTVWPIFYSHSGAITRIIIGCEFVRAFERCSECLRRASVFFQIRFGMKGWLLTLATYGKSQGKVQ